MRRVTPSAKPDRSALNRFLDWLFSNFRPKKKQPKILEEIRESPLGKLAAYERFDEQARYTWRFVPVSGEYQAWLYCDSLRGSERSTLDTHNITLLIIDKSGASHKHWSIDRNMRSLAGENNCAAIVTRILAAQLLHYHYSDVPWVRLADRAINNLMPGPKG
jgi:hypothetical protein